MMKRSIRWFFAIVLVLWLSVSVLAQTARWEGIVTRSNKQKFTLTVRARASTSFDEKIIHYDSTTQFTAQAHGDKTPKVIDASQIKDGDRVICLGYYNDKGEFQAALISKRL
jgi:hypothetical protein